MEDSIPKLIPEDQFNESVKNWTVVTRRKMRANIQSGTKHAGKEWKGRKSKKLSQSISYRFRKQFGSISSIRYSFERHGVYLHYGVGRGYVRSGNTVTRGKRSGNNSKDISNGAINRTPVDWFDVEIRTGLKTLADAAQEYYGDLALKSILDQSNKALIEK